MKDINDIKIIIAIVLIIFLLSNCELFLKDEGAGVEISRDIITIKGRYNLTKTLEIPAGTTVKFEPIYKDYINFAAGCRVHTDEKGDRLLSGEIIAQGTPDNPIVFTSDDPDKGRLYLYNNSIVEYCEFRIYSVSSLDNTTIRFCKFINCELSCDSDIKIKNNTFINSSCFCGTGYMIKTTNEFTYNEIKENENSSGLYVSCSSITSPTISYNNFIDIKYCAIDFTHHFYTYPASYTVSNNYIADCNGKTGVDTTGGQSNNIIYVNPQTSPIDNAGCGW